MAQPNVAREPSMEEILASIRRIIESNDPVSESEAAAGSPVLEDADDEFDLDDSADASFLSQVPANDPGRPLQGAVEPAPLRGTIDPRSGMPVQPAFAAQPPSAAIEQQEKTMSLADVAARVRAAAGRVPEPMQARSMPPQTTPVPQPREFSADVARPEQPVRAEPSVRVEPSLRSEQPVRSEPVMSDIRPAQPLHEMRGPVADTAAVFASPRAEPSIPQREAERHASTVSAQSEKPVANSLPAKIEEAAMLLSHEAGEQVARSFKELVDVFNGMERQSVEDMARDMLQPMLREWLDDNLPTLVERLVREEIERVARGPRR